jgi:hypothetical protein
MDGQGSVRYLTDSANIVTDSYTYDAFGKLISLTGSTPGEYLYAGGRIMTEGMRRARELGLFKGWTGRTR